MRRGRYDPLTYIPAPDTLRRHLAEAEELARRLRIVLRVSENLHERPENNSRDGQEARGAE